VRPNRSFKRTCPFYRDGLGFETKGIAGAEIENGAVAFFSLEPGLKLALWPRKSLARDSGLPLQAPSGTEFSLSHNVASQQAVDTVMQQAERAGARIVKPAQPTLYGGHAGYFQDPDGHLWEAAFNPGFASLGQGANGQRYESDAQPLTGTSEAVNGFVLLMSCISEPWCCETR